MTAFDSFAWPAGQLGFRASNGPLTPADFKGQTGNVPSPLFFVDRQTNATLVVSPMDHFHGWACTAVDNMGPGSESSPGPSGWGCGIMNTVPELPAGFVSGTVLFGGVGVTDTMAKWGSAMQAWYNTTREKDLQTTKLGVYTDNGICTASKFDWLRPAASLHVLGGDCAASEQSAAACSALRGIFFPPPNLQARSTTIQAT